MKNKTMWLSTLLCLTPILFGLAVYERLPEMVPTHFDLAGNPNGWSSRAMAVFGLPLFLAFINLLCHWVTGRDEKTNKATPKVLKGVIFWIVPVLSCLVVPMSLFEGLGVEVPIGFILSILIGVLFVVIGNYLPKCKPNYHVGIKLPWTFASEENWRKTHRFGGKVWVVAGFLAVIAGIFRLDILLMAVLFGAIVLPCGYSYLEFKKEQK